MKRVMGGLLIAASLAGVASDALARGHGGFRGGGYRGGYGHGVRFGAYIGVPLAVGIGAASYYNYAYGAPYYYGGYPYGYWYPPVPVTGVATAPVYIEQGSAAAAPAQSAAAPASGYWYYCMQSQGYYPYVRECPGGWQQVAPQPSR